MTVQNSRATTPIARSICGRAGDTTHDVVACLTGPLPHNSDEAPSQRGIECNARNSLSEGVPKSKAQRRAELQFCSRRRSPTATKNRGCSAQRLKARSPSIAISAQALRMKLLDGCASAVSYVVTLFFADANEERMASSSCGGKARISKYSLSSSSTWKRSSPEFERKSFRSLAS